MVIELEQRSSLNAFRHCSAWLLDPREKPRCLGQGRCFASQGESIAIREGNLIWDVSQTFACEWMVLCKTSGGILSKNCEIIFKHSWMRARKEAKLESKSRKWTIRCQPAWVFVLMENITGTLHRAVLGKTNHLGFFLKIWNHPCFRGVLSGLWGRPSAAHLSWGQGFFPLGLSESREGYSLVLKNVKGNVVTLAWRHFGDTGSMSCKSPVGLRNFKATFLISKESFVIAKP